MSGREASEPSAISLQKSQTTKNLIADGSEAPLPLVVLLLSTWEAQETKQTQYAKRTGAQVVSKA